MDVQEIFKVSLAVLSLLEVCRLCVTPPWVFALGVCLGHFGSSLVFFDVGACMYALMSLCSTCVTDTHCGFCVFVHINFIL